MAGHPRGLARPGWGEASVDAGTAVPYAGELLWVKLDGSGAVLPEDVPLALRGRGGDLSAVGEPGDHVLVAVAVAGISFCPWVRLCRKANVCSMAPRSIVTLVPRSETMGPATPE